MGYYNFNQELAADSTISLHSMLFLSAIEGTNWRNHEIGVG